MVLLIPRIASSARMRKDSDQRLRRPLDCGRRISAAAGKLCQLLGEVLQFNRLAPWHIGQPLDDFRLPVRRVSRDNLDENGSDNQSLKWRPVAKS